MRADGDYGRDPFGKAVQEAEYGDRISTQEDRERLAPQIRQLAEQGYVILTNALSPAQLDAIRGGLDDVNSGTGFARSAFLGEKTQRPYGLLGKTATVWPLAAHPDVVAICEAHMEDQIQLSSLTAATLHPGQPAQTLHRDDGFYNLPDPHGALSVSTIWALDDFTAENGGTLVIPGSHEPASVDQPAGKAINVEMPAGSVLLWTGALWHGGGANVSTNSIRRGVIILYCRAWLRLAAPAGEPVSGRAARGGPRHAPRAATPRRMVGRRRRHGLR
jgi:hypothetical protein